MNQNLAVKQNFHCYIHKDVYAPPFVLFVQGILKQLVGGLDLLPKGTKDPEGLHIPIAEYPGNYRTSFVAGELC